MGTRLRETHQAPSSVNTSGPPGRPCPAVTSPQSPRLEMQQGLGQARRPQVPGRRLQALRGAPGPGGGRRGGWAGLHLPGPPTPGPALRLLLRDQPGHPAGGLETSRGGGRCHGRCPGATPVPRWSRASASRHRTSPSRGPPSSHGPPCPSPGCAGGDSAMPWLTSAGGSVTPDPMGGPVLRWAAAGLGEQGGPWTCHPVSWSRGQDTPPASAWGTQTQGQVPFPDSQRDPQFPASRAGPTLSPGGTSHAQVPTGPVPTAVQPGLAPPHLCARGSGRRPSAWAGGAAGCAAPRGAVGGGGRARGRGSAPAWFMAGLCPPAGHSRSHRPRQPRARPPACSDLRPRPAASAPQAPGVGTDVPAAGQQQSPW